MSLASQNACIVAQLALDLYNSGPNDAPFGAAWTLRPLESHKPADVKCHLH